MDPVTTAALIGGGASLLGGAFGSSGAKKAAKQTAKAMDNQTTAANRAAYNSAVMGMLTGAPQMEASYTALSGMMDMLGLNRGITGSAGLDDGRMVAHGGGVGGGAGSTAGLDPVALAKLKPGLHANDAIRSAYYNMMTGIGTGSAALAAKPTYDWQASPSYQWRFGEGQRAVESSLLAAGLGGSGAALKQLTEYGQGMASQEYDQIFARLATIAGFGPAGMNSASGGQSTAANLIGNNQGLIGSGMAAAQGTIGSTNAWAGALNQIAMLPWDKIFSGEKNNYWTGTAGSGVPVHP